MGIHNVSLRGVRYLANLPSQSSAVVWDDQGLLIYEWDDGDPDGMEWVGAHRTRARGKPKRLEPEEIWFTSPDGTLRVRSESGNVLVKPVSDEGDDAPRTIEHGKLYFGTGGFLAPDRPSWAGPHHLFAEGDVIDLTTGDQRPVRTNRWAEVLAFSPDGKTVVIAADGELWYGPAHDAK